MVAATVSPVLVAPAVLGATAPDWLEWVAGAVTRHPIKHRTVTHVLLSWVCACAFFGVIADFRGLGLAFSLGGVSHWLCDACTIQGVPLWWWSDRRTTIAGGRIRTGGMGEYAVVGGVLACCLVLASLRPSEAWSPFFRDWPNLYAAGVVDGSEWRSHRFELF
jgi:inner membrane protein